MILEVTLHGNLEGHKTNSASTVHIFGVIYYFIINCLFNANVTFAFVLSNFANLKVRLLTKKLEQNCKKVWHYINPV